ncbi:PSD1 and planctomycete cytochrome C domain-containing protein [Planctomyces sp. SH-PL62]|uniref:PSD1 and planctomycete cytochrome C domain-containing protein n=1 Tax=Planctomyces sp. SH-PL62 TaxID=1636152 RepID=UPI00078EB6B4|nr:PSD1 and planctomycete cytochrome C domain-containing protein [Planctomyces sp. SH-PL62]AMV38136.1 Planctomycete cytochrome C [Planctomyces sp. SH-PL62]
MSTRLLLISAAVLAPLGAGAALGGDPPPASSPDAAKVEFFEKKIRPLLVAECYNCHSANTKAASGLRVDDLNGLVQGGDRGEAVVPGKPEESLLLQSVAHLDDAPRMPPKKKLSDEQVADLTRWVAEGAAWPAEAVAASQSTSNEEYARLRAEHWAWQPLKDAAPPDVRDAAWPRGDVDRYILASLERESLAPVGDADRTTLIRRVSFDLTGLPPTPEEISAFLADDASDAFAKVVDRLLASPAFGERWGRHWLDVARYAESTGASRNLPYPHAWRYRDYVVDAFNRDKPFDQFVREQIAGDLLPASSKAERDEHAIATGFLAIGQKDVNQRFKVRFVMDNVDEQIDAVSRGFLGVTASCARCHDHKFDPIPTSDYYALAGIFRSTDLCAGVRNKMGGGGLDYYDSAMLIPLGETAERKDDPALAEKVAAATKAFEDARKEFQKIRGTPEGLAVQPNGRPKQFQYRQKMVRLQNELLELTDPAATGQVAIGVRDSREIADTEVRIRGEAEKLGPVVPRGVLGVVPIKAPEIPSNQSGRLELAEWIASPDNPLTSRVFVNRTWRHLFGRGIVKTVDNLGVNGDVPSHPELLDHLAAKFVADGWSVKTLVRSLVLSRAYGLSSEARESNVTADPANRLVWRHAPRRLTGEEIRDATLAAAGSLDPSRPTASPAKALKVMELPNNGPVAREILETARGSASRSVYLPLLRGLTPTSLEVFDFAEQGMVTGDRDTTTVATQALYFLNDPLVRRESLRLAERLLARAELDDAARVDLAYRLTLGRSPSAAEADRGRGFLADYEALAAAEPEPTPEPEPEPKPAAVAAADAAGAAKPPAQVIDPDQVIPVDTPLREEVVRASSPRAAAWAGFCQALIGSAEFRYVR